MRDVFIIMLAMPVMVNSAIVARIYGGDYEFAVKNDHLYYYSKHYYILFNVTEKYN